MIASLFIVALPVLMALAEATLRVTLKVDAAGFINPSLASAAISMVAPLMFPRKRQVIINGETLSARRTYDSHISEVSIIFFMISFFVWILIVHNSASEMYQTIEKLQTARASGALGANLIQSGGHEVDSAPLLADRIVSASKNDYVGYLLYYFALLLLSTRGGIELFMQWRRGK